MSVPGGRSAFTGQHQKPTDNTNGEGAWTRFEFNEGPTPRNPNYKSVNRAIEVAGDSLDNMENQFVSDASVLQASVVLAAVVMLLYCMIR